MQDHVAEINRKAAEIARRAADDFTRRDPDRPRFVAGSIGPTNKTLYIEPGHEPPGHAAPIPSTTSWRATPPRSRRWSPAASICWRSKPATTSSFSRRACSRIDKYFAEHNVRLPTIVSGTIYDNGRTLLAQTPEAFYVSVSHFDALAVGFNCGVGVDLLRGPVESLAAVSRKPIAVYPNAGLPDGMGGFTGDRDRTAALLGEFARNGWVNIVGGCCGTTPEWIAAIGRAVEGVAPRRVPEPSALVVLLRQRGAGGPAGDEFRHDRRALQHHRLAQVQAPHQGGQLRRGHRRWRASRCRTAPTSSTSTWTPT